MNEVNEVHDQEESMDAEDHTIVNNEGWEHICASAYSLRSINYIRDLVDHLPLKPNPELPVIALSIGDPCVYGNLRAPREAHDAIAEAVMSPSQIGKWDGYAPCAGHETARDAVATYLSHDGVRVRPEDVYLCSGCSHALDMALTVLVDGPSRGDNVLIARPSFPLYRTLVEGGGAEVRYYRLLPEKEWQVDLVDLESKIDDRTAAIVINNPSNPCGSVWPEEHLQEILAIARRKRVPIIADEIYEQLVFGNGSERCWTSLLSIANDVPILMCGGLAKRFLVPGWRLGWLVVHDPPGAFKASVRRGLQNLSARIVGSNTLVQSALARLLLLTPQSYHDDLINTLMENARTAYDAIVKVHGLKPYMPQGTMYMMVRIEIEHFPDFENTLQFVVKMMEEQSVFCLPGEVCNTYLFQIRSLTILRKTRNHKLLM